MDLDSRQLRYVVQLATDLNFTRAAKTLHVAQQTLSEAIKQLERQLGVALFDRSPQHVELTAAGAVFVAQASELLERIDAAVAATHAEARRQAGSISVGTPDWPSGIGLFRRAIERSRATVDGPAILIDPTPWIAHIGAVAAGRIDVGVTFVGGPGDLPDGLVATPLVDDDAGWIFVAQDHPLTRLDTVTVRDLEPYPILMIRRGDHPALHDRLADQLRRAGVDPRLPDNNTGSFATALAHSTAGSGVVMISASMAATPPAYMAALRVDALAIGLQLVAITRAGDERPHGLLERLVEEARTPPGA